MNGRMAGRTTVIIMLLSPAGAWAELGNYVSNGSKRSQTGSNKAKYDEKGSDGLE